LNEMMRRLPLTVELAIGTVVISLFIAIPTGIISAVRQDSLLDYIGRFLSIAGLSMPGFWIGTLFIIFGAIWFGYLPPPGFTSPLENPWTNFQQIILPCLAMGINDSARSMRMTRSQMLEVIRQDYIRTAWAKGLRERTVIVRHAMKNALIPVVTVIGLLVGSLVGGNVVLETMFALPGMGQFVVVSFLNNDLPMVQGVVLILGTVLVLTNTVVDISYAWLDPRIRYR